MRTKRSTIEKEAARVAKRTIVQLLFSTGVSYTLDGLREKLRSFYKDENAPEVRAAAAFRNDELIDIILEANGELAELGLHLMIVNGAVRFVTTKVHAQLSAFLASKSPSPKGLTPSLLNVLSVIAGKQPITQAEINHHFDCDKRDAVYALRELGLVDFFADGRERLRYVTTEAFLMRFKLDGIEEFHALLDSTTSSAGESFPS